VKRKTTADDVRQVLLAAVADALDDGKQEARKRPGLTGVRAMATGAVLYTAGRAAVAGRRFYRDRFGADAQGDGDEHEDEYDDEHEQEPYAEGDAEEYADDDEDEPRAGGNDQEYDDDDEDEPRAERDEHEDDDDRFDPADRPPVHGDADDEHVDTDLPPRPSRRRRPVKT
jgi:hypothetical protein